MKFKQRSVLLRLPILVILGSSIVLNALLYDQAKKYYVELNQTRLDPLGLAEYPINPQVNSPASSNAQVTRVVFFGDSRAASWPSPKLSGYEFINRGIASQTSIQALQRFPFHVRSLKPDVVIVQVGINDLKTVALFPDRRTSIVTACQANIRQIVEASRQLGAVVIVTTIFPTGEVPLARRPFWSDDIAQTIKETNAYIATLANDRTIVFDAFSILADPQGQMPQKYRSNELHVNDQGYDVLNQELVRRLNQIKRKPS
jgi:lysophospholipase L1-like esterase